MRIEDRSEIEVTYCGGNVVLGLTFDSRFWRFLVTECF